MGLISKQKLCEHTGTHRHTHTRSPHHTAMGLTFSLVDATHNSYIRVLCVFVRRTLRTNENV